MKAPTLLAAVAAASVSAQLTTPATVTPSASLPTTRTETSFSTETADCSTLKGPKPLTFDFFGTQITTSFQITYTTTQNGTLPASTYYSQKTVTVTRNATTVTSLATTVETATATRTSFPATVTIAPFAGQLPLQFNPLPTPSTTASAVRVPRRGLDARSPNPYSLFTRDTPVTERIGYIADPITGKRIPIERTWYTLAIVCAVRVTPYEVLYVTNPDVTSTQQATGTALATTTVTTTTTVDTVAPTPTFYQACGANNIVNHLDYDNAGRPLYFDRVYFWRGSGNNSDVNEVGVDAQSAYDCCVKCQIAPEGCSQAFFVPGELKCQMRLRLPLAPSPSTPSLPSGTIVPIPSSLVSGIPIGTAVLPVPTGVLPNPACPAGSLTEYVGVIRGRECFRPELAWSFINGPCGRLSINPVAVDAPGSGIGGDGNGNGTETATCSLVGTPSPTATVLARGIGGVSL